MTPRTNELETVRSELKDFQRQTVRRVIQQLLGGGAPRGRFLVADEVGLGKTFVARGVIAEAIMHWRSQGRRRIDVIYICSNAEIARQNIERLNVLQKETFSFSSRITLLPRELGRVKRQTLNLVGFTPGTSFRLSGGMGLADERVELYEMLRRAWPETRKLRLGMQRLLQGGVRKTETFRERIRDARDQPLDERIVRRFIRDLSGRDASRPLEDRLRVRFTEAARWYQRLPDDSDLRYPRRRELVSELRRVLATACLQSVKADLIILDEFQRFRELLDPDSEPGRLARHLFDREGVKTLLLSATPYRPFKLAEEAGADQDHYKDFLATQRFLLGEDGIKRLREELSAFSTALVKWRIDPDALPRARMAKERLETRLQTVMARTERPQSENDFLVERTTALVPAASDVSAYVSLDAIARRLASGDVVEYWKSAPYFLSLMDDYKIKKKLMGRRRDPELAQDLRKLSSTGSGLLDEPALRAYREIDGGNARMRELAQDTIACGAWRLLWLPPSMAYYQPAWPFDQPGVQGLTKRLVFSAWKVTPKAVASLLSYDAERRLITNDDRRRAKNNEAARQRIRPLLRFQESQRRLTGMPVLALLYPSPALAQLVDPLTFASGDPAPDMKAVLRGVKEQLRPLVRRITADAERKGPPDEAWYWAAPILLDRERPDRNAWLARGAFRDANLGESDDSEATGDSWEEHALRAEGLRMDRLGRPPGNLIEVLALIAIAGPGTAILRSILRVVGESADDCIDTYRSAAASGAWAMRGLFNLPEAIRLLRPTRQTRWPYWRLVLGYCAAGNIQAVLDEYAHILKEAAPHGTQTAIADNIAKGVRAALDLRASVLSVDTFSKRKGRLDSVMTLRGRFALRYSPDSGTTEHENELHQVSRPDQVRHAFNSPFWPFVLATTSVGQEGLDFHHYCHAVVHWNLPANPVDLEQREGRVQRYKGHAVRLNVARCHRAAGACGGGDPWKKMFDAAVSSRPPDSTDLEPFWYYSCPGGARIQRHIPAFVLSREQTGLVQLKRMLGAYRVVMGQPHQDDLLQYLLAGAADKQIQDDLRRLAISLTPRGVV